MKHTKKLTRILSSTDPPPLVLIADFRASCKSAGLRKDSVLPKPLAVVDSRSAKTRKWPLKSTVSQLHVGGREKGHLVSVIYIVKEPSGCLFYLKRLSVSGGGLKSLSWHEEDWSQLSEPLPLKVNLRGLSRASTLQSDPTRLWKFGLPSFRHLPLYPANPTVIISLTINMYGQ